MKKTILTIQIPSDLELEKLSSLLADQVEKEMAKRCKIASNDSNYQCPENECWLDENGVCQICLSIPVCSYCQHGPKLKNPRKNISLKVLK